MIALFTDFGLHGPYTGQVRPAAACLAGNAFSMLDLDMAYSFRNSLPPNLASELEGRFFRWKPVDSQPRSDARILAQAMDLAPFETVLRLERELGSDHLADTMLAAEPGWISGRSWEFWRDRLVRATGRAIPEEPPRRSMNTEAS